MRSLVKLIIGPNQYSHYTILNISAPPSFTGRPFLLLQFLSRYGKKPPRTLWYARICMDMCARVMDI